MSSGLWSTTEEHDILAQGRGTQIIKSCKGSPESAKVPPQAPAVSLCNSKMTTGRDRGTQDGRRKVSEEGWQMKFKR